MLRFITDLGEDVELRGPDGVLKLQRYGVWEHQGWKDVVVEVSDDLYVLQAKWGPELQVVVLGGEHEKV